MKSASNLARLAALVAPVFAAPQGLGVQYVDVNSGPQLPSVWLYWHDDKGTEAYSAEAQLNMECISGSEPGWEGVWVEQDPRSEGNRIGCAYTYEKENCEGNPGGKDLTGLGDAHNKVEFGNPSPGYRSKSFRFSHDRCEGVGSALEKAGEIVTPTAP